MQTKSNLTAVVIIPPEKLWDPIQRIRHQYDRHVHRWMPHISLLFPFRPHSQFAFLVERFSAACKGIQPVQITLAEIRHFEHGSGSYTLWLAPEPAQPIRQLVERLLTVVPDCSDTSSHHLGFTPHLTLGNVKGRQPFQQLLDTLQKQWQPVSFTLSGMQMIWRNEPPDDAFRVAEEIRWQAE